MRRKEIKCPKCRGTGCIEYEAGLIMLPCLDCEGNGIILEPYKTVGEIFKGEVENAGDNVGGTGQANQPDGGEDTGKPKSPRKRKARKKAGA